MANHRKPIELINKCIELYKSGKTMKEICDIEDTNITTLKKYLKQNNIKIRRENKNSQKWTVNQDYFKIIDTEEKAYWLGFIYADGNVYLNEKDRRSVFNFNLKGSDEYMIEKLKKCISYTGPIFTKKYKNPKYNSAKGINVGNKELCINLINLGCVPRKSCIIKFPTYKQVPQNLYHHFLRGYFDGDGSVGIYSTNKSVSIASSHEFIKSWNDFFFILFGKQGYIYNRGKFSTIRYSSKNLFLKFRNFFYQDATIFLERKHKIFYSI